MTKRKRKVLPDTQRIATVHWNPPPVLYFREPYRHEHYVDDDDWCCQDFASERSLRKWIVFLRDSDLRFYVERFNPHAEDNYEGKEECDHCHEWFLSDDLRDWTGYYDDVDPPDRICDECHGNRVMEQ